MVIVACTVCISTQAQVFSSIAFKSGFSYSGQFKSPELADDGGEKTGFTATLEPTLESFGVKNRFHLHLAIGYVQKGGFTRSPVYSYDAAGNIISEGSEMYAVTQNYLALTPSISFDYGEKFYLKLGPRMDFFTGFRSGAQFSGDNRKKENFEKINLGASLAIGYLQPPQDNKRTRFNFEVVGQPDFTVSTINPTTEQKLTNYSFLFNFGFIVDLVPLTPDREN